MLSVVSPAEPGHADRRADPSTLVEKQRCGPAVFTAHFLSGARALVGVTGDVDATNRQALGRFVQHHTHVSSQLVLDLRRVDFFGSQGFTVLHYVSVHCARRDVDWVVVGNRDVVRILGICDPDAELPVAADLSLALKRLDHVPTSVRPFERA